MFGHGDHEGHGPHFDESDEFRLKPRLSYLLMLMRHAQVEKRRGGDRHNVSQGQGRVLSLLAKSSPVSQKELAYLLGIRSQSLAELVSKLEKAGLVERQPDPNDRRTSLVDLTGDGRAAAENIAAEPDAGPFSVLDDEDKQRFADLLDKVIDGMEGQLPNGPDPRMQMFKRMAFGDGDLQGGPGFGAFGPRGFGPRGFGGFGRGGHEGGE
jgi:DNA-binding MarR family transcriptional regulator